MSQLRRPDSSFKISVDPLIALWRSLRQPWLLLVLGLIALLLIVAALYVPQLPPELATDAAAVARWEIGMAAQYGVWGPVMQSLGLFDVLHSLLLRILFGLIGLVLSVHLADQIGAVLHFRRLSNVLSLKTDAPDRPVLESSPVALYRLRQTSSSPAQTTASMIDEYIAEAFESIQRTTIHYDGVQSANGANAVKQADVSSLLDHTEPVAQERILAQRGQLAVYLRPLLMLGLLSALIPVWMITTLGWELYPAALAPGERVEYRSQGLVVKYSVAVGDNATAEERAPSDVTRTLSLQVGEDSVDIVVEGNVDTRVGDVDVSARFGPPGLFISTTDGETELMRPGSSVPTASIGLVFPGAGNEEAVLLPYHSTALRIVRRDEIDELGYVIQVLDRDGNPVAAPIRIDGSEKSVLALEFIDRPLRLDPVPALTIRARYLPGTRLLLASLGLVLIGVFGYWQRPGYLLLQIAPWPPDKALAIAQSDKRAEIEAIEKIIKNDESQL